MKTVLAGVLLAGTLAGCETMGSPGPFDSERAALGLQLLQMAQPRPMPMMPMMVRPSVFCTSRPGYGGSVSTVCN